MIKSLSDKLFSTKPSGTLYHYTSLTGLEGILSSGSLWATDIRYLNDAAEMRHTAEIIRIEIAKRLEQGSGNQKLLSQLKEWIFDRLENGHMLFVTSFFQRSLDKQTMNFCFSAHYFHSFYFVSILAIRLASTSPPVYGPSPSPSF